MRLQRRVSAMRIRVAVIGGGSWGTTVAHLAADHVPTVLWARRPELADEINLHHRNERYLPGYQLHPDLRATADLAEAVRPGRRAGHGRARRRGSDPRWRSAPSTSGPGCRSCR